MKRLTVLMEEAMTPMSDEQLGKAFRAYVEESNHQGWDAWPKRDLRGVLAFFRDFTIFLNVLKGET